MWLWYKVEWKRLNKNMKRKNFTEFKKKNEIYEIFEKNC